MGMSVTAVNGNSGARASNPAVQIAALQRQVTGLMKQMKALQKQLLGMGEGEAKKAVQQQLEAVARQIALVQQQIQTLQSERATAKVLPDAKGTEVMHGASKKPLQSNHLMAGSIVNTTA
jgi:hypothetical protein